MRTDSARLYFYETHHKDFRYHGHPTMDNKYPAWSVWTALQGKTPKTVRKTLREAIDLAMNDLEFYRKSVK